MRDLSRRQFVTGAATVVGATWAGIDALAKTPTNLRGGEILPDPDFSLLREETSTLIGIRPYRTAGVRLELEPAPLRGTHGDTFLIHNYGHGGAGVTLSWGCAQAVTDHVHSVRERLPTLTKPISVAVIGTGIIGLTTAVELRRRWPDLPITIFAKDLDLESTVSWVAGGQFEPSGMHRLYKTPERRKTLHDWVRRSRDRVVEIQSSGNRHAYGVAVRKNYALDRPMKAFDEAVPRDVIKRPRRGALPFAHLNHPGREYLTWLQNPSLMMPRLVADLKASGVRFETRNFQSLRDIAELPHNIVVNCTGYGARKLCADESLVPQRGHNVLLKKTDDRQFYFFSGGCKNWVIAYIFCRQNDIVVGGTIQKGNDSLARTPEDQKIFDTLLTNGRELFAGRPDACAKI